jgi:hypothetical protein
MPWLDVVITFSNADPGNVDTTFGTPQQWPGAGFPFRSRAAYQQRVRETLLPLVPYLDTGRRLYAQAENEIGEASILTATELNGATVDTKYWRGTTDQYLIQVSAFYEAVRAVDPRIVVVPTPAVDTNRSSSITTQASITTS